MNDVWKRLLRPVGLGKLREPYARYAATGLVVLIIVGSLFGQYQIFANALELDNNASQNENNFSLLKHSVGKLIGTKTAIDQAKGLGADTIQVEGDYQQTKETVFANASALTLAIYKQVVTVFNAATQTLTDRQAFLNAEAQLGIVEGIVVTGNTALENVTVSFKSDTAEGSAKTDKSGQYHLQITAGSYTATASKSGYSSLSKKVTVTAKQSVALDFSLTIYVAPPKTTANTGSATNGDSSYSLQSVSSSAGTFSAHVAKFNLASGQFKVITDTANDTDCAADCPTKSLGSYVSLHGAFAGMNGTYFCPADYASCASEKNAFFWKILNYRTGTMINGSNGNGENDPFFAFTATAGRYFSSWSSFMGSGYGAISGINSWPLLISNNANVLNINVLDDKQRYTKSNRGAIGLEGQLLYLVVAKSATVVDLAAIMDALGVDYATNLDGGGSSAMIFNGSYKAGPGRSLPNAIVVKRN